MGEFESVETPSKKRKKKPEVDAEENVPEKKSKSFCCRTFRQELKGSEALKSLKRFISAAKNSDDVIFEYLEIGGSIQEILSLIDVTATGDLTTALPVFEVVHLILLRFQSADSKHHESCIDSARTILRLHMPTIKAMLSMNITKQKKVALKVLTAIATLDSSFANEIMNVVALSPTLITDLIQPSPEKESVRKCFILFVLSFLVEGNLVVVKNLLDKKGFLGSIIPGLKYDEASTVNLALSLFEDKILKNVKIPKTLKLKLFNTQIIKSLFDLYDWKGLQGTKQILPTKKNKVKEIEVVQSEKEVVIESVHSFLMLLCCSQKFGVAFYDKSMGTSEQLNNQLLLTVFESLSDPLKNKKVAEVLLKTTASCPDIMKPLLVKLEPSFQPRNSKNWFQAMEFAGDLIKAMDATTALKNETESLTASQIAKVGKALCAPIVFLRVVKLGSQKSQQMEIQFRSLTLLKIIWDEFEKLLTTFQIFKEDLKKSLHKHILKSLPDVLDMVELWHTLCDVEFLSSLPLSQDKKVMFLKVVLDSLHIIVECQNDAVASPLNLTSDLLNHVENIKDSISKKEFEEIQVKIVQFVEIDLQALTPQMELFEKSLLILLRSIEESSLSNLSKIFASLDVFKKNKAEVDVWLLSFTSLPREYRPLVADFLIESIRLSFKKSNEESMDCEEQTVPMDENDQKQSEESITPLLFNCIEVLKSYSSTLSKKDEKLISTKHFLSDLVIHLQHFYTINVYLYDHLKDVSKVCSKACLNYLKNWKTKWVKSVEVDMFPCAIEFNLICWLINESKSAESIREVIDLEKTNLLQLYSLFRIVVAYFTKKTIAGDLEEKVEKFIEALSFLLYHPPEDDRDYVELVSANLNAKSVYQRRCLECLFRNGYLLKGFDVFQKKENFPTAVLFEIFIQRNVVKSLQVKRKLSEPWKFRFLKQLKVKLKKCKSIEGFEKLEKVFDYFLYDHTDVEEMIKMLMSVTDLDLFINGHEPSSWVVILSKFIKMHCQKEELNESVVKKLCLIMKHLNKRCTTGLEQITDCFIYLIRKHPSHLLIIENEFLDVVLMSIDSTPSCITLGKLLLNDPKKVKYFFEFIKKDLEKCEIVLPLLSSLIVGENSFLHVGETRAMWKMSEISQNGTPELFDVLEIIYKKFEKNIFQVMAGEKLESFSGNLELTREIVKLFFDCKKLLKMKKEISKGKFEPELVFEAVKKLNESEITENYVQGLLVLFSRMITKSKDEEEEEYWSKYCCLVTDVIELNKDLNWQNVVDSSEWTEFAKLSLGFCLSSMKHAPLLKILRLFFTTFYKSKESEDCGLFFQMMISHSQFLRVMLSRSPLKFELVELFYDVIKKCPSEMSPKHFPIFLASYNASLSHCDVTLLRVLKFYEQNGVGVSDYEPFVWGETAVSHYSIGTSSGLSLWQRFNMGNVLDLLDAQRLELSLKEFPIRRSLDTSCNIEFSETNVYDPAFILPLFVNLLSPGSVVFCLSFIYKGGLAYTVRALSSECKDVRLVASTVLTRFYNHLELSQNLKQKLVWMHFINCFRYGIEDLSAQPLPNISTLFFARMTLELSRQPAELFLPLQNYLLAKFYFSFDTVPEFLPLFHSSEVSYRKHREWLLEVMRDGTKTTSDVNIIFHSMAPKIIFCFFYSQLCDIETKKLILQVIERMLRVDKSILLISEYGLLNWITSIDSDFFQSILNDLLQLLSTVVGVIVKDIKYNKIKHSNSSHLIQILNMAVKLLPSLKTRKSVEAFKMYLKVINECFMFFVKEGKSDWFKLNKKRLSDIVEAGVILGEEYDCGKYRKVPFYFRDFDEECRCEDLKKAIFLFGTLVSTNE